MWTFCKIQRQSNAGTYYSYAVIKAQQANAAYARYQCGFGADYPTEEAATAAAKAWIKAMNKGPYAVC